MKDFNYYIKQGDVRKTTRDLSLAESLIKRSNENASYVLKLELTNEGASIVFKTIYDSLREAVDAILILEGYRSYSHQASIIFLKKFNELSEEDLNKLDNFRIKRNNSLYYGKSITLDETKEIAGFYKNKIGIILRIINNLKRVK